MNEFVCSLDGRWSIGPYCVAGEVVAGGLIFALVILTMLLLGSARARRLGPTACPVCGLVYATRRLMEAHRWREHEDHKAPR